MFSVKRKIQRVLLSAAMFALFCSWAGCAKKPEGDSGFQKAETKPSGSTSAVFDKPLPDFQVELLELGFEAASSIPVQPFIKDRSRAQEKAVDACLSLGQPVRAVRYADKIKNWRRGLCYANTACYLAENGCAAEQVQKGLELAEQIAALDHGQQWRSDRIKARIAHTYILLGHVQQAEQFSQGLLDSESGQLTATRAVNDAFFDDQVKSLDASIALQNFDIMKNALYAYTALFDRHYDDTERRALLEQKIKTSWDKMPLSIRFDLAIRLADSALNHSDQKKAVELVNESQIFLDHYQWPLEKYVPMMATQVEFRFKTGAVEKARSDADSTWTLYTTKREGVLISYRVESILPLAEVFQAMGNTPKARSVYRQAIDECIENTNPKTRAEDLSATCCSMARSAVEPDAELWKRLHEVRDGLDGQW